MKKTYVMGICIIFCSFLLNSNLYAAEKLTVLLDWFPNADHAPLFVAEQQGFFKEAGLDVELIGPADPADPPKLVAAGKADIAITYEPQLLEQIDEGLPLVRIATLIDKPLSCLVVLNNSSIHSLSDLKNKRIGYSTSNVTDVVLKTMLEKNGVHLQDVQTVNVHYDLTQALLSKKIEAVTGMMRTFEVLQLELAGQPARVFLPEKNGVPSYDELVLVINKKNITDKRFPKFVTALQKGVDYLEKHPDSSWKLFVKSHPELNDTLNQRAWFATLPYFSHQPAKFNAQEWETFAKFMKKNGLIKNAHSVADYAIII
ncbi:MAG TPA: ABC transporter substrate-binding protein [Gammaproteobacteria bacterium]|nr:ABC transporter substrate-binding protein [Gammaproteobacteria bacterium]